MPDASATVMLASLIGRLGLLRPVVKLILNHVVYTRETAEIRGFGGYQCFRVALWVEKPAKCRNLAATGGWLDTEDRAQT